MGAPPPPDDPGGTRGDEVNKRSLRVAGVWAPGGWEGVGGLRAHMCELLFKSYLSSKWRFKT